MKKILTSRDVTGPDCFSEANAIGRVSLFPLERDLLEAIVERALGGDAMWRRQIDHLQVRRRHFDRNGFRSFFLLADPTLVVMPFVANEVVSGWIRADLPGGKASLSPVLHMERGIMVMLEGLGQGEGFPAEIGPYQVATDRQHGPNVGPPDSTLQAPEKEGESGVEEAPGRYLPLFSDQKSFPANLFFVLFLVQFFLARMRTNCVLSSRVVGPRGL
jgi:hypothetical protein